MPIGRKAKIAINLGLLLLCIYGLAMGVWSLLVFETRFGMDQFIILVFCFIFIGWGITRFRYLRSQLKKNA